ncbi:DinB family protein [Natronococcus occultus]|uniref:Glutaredoxin-like protein n=1 Tax=Natronococcus occultus SP4 TaxID=694430 RepID=L0JYX1_9EURY|nr:DinB family protein [Natronococcus occultus]AGB37068.1 glutaredoxin-like protein [Natronococcus occultus SP4]
MTVTESEIHLYWATGCTSCLRVKEFLERNDVSFVSHNVVQGDNTTSDPADEAAIGVRGVDPEIIDEMAELGLPEHVPVVKRGDEWADGKDLKKIANLVGIEYDAEPLPVEELRRRLDILLNTTHQYLEQLPESELKTHIPNRPRSYADLVQHIFSLTDVFLMHEAGVSMDSVPRMEHCWDHYSKVALSTYGQSVQGRLDDWFEDPGQMCDWSETADVFWGEPTKHEFLERTTWHAGQHVRQLEWILENELKIDIDEPLEPDLWEGLPMPKQVWNTD